MAFCRQCGKEMPNEATFCNNCGMPVGMVQPLVYVKPKVPGRGFGISSMVLGIIGFVYSFIYSMGISSMLEEFDKSSSSAEPESILPAIIMLSVLPILSVCFSPAAIKRGYKNGVSISGLILGVLALIGYIYIGFVIFNH